MTKEEAYSQICETYRAIDTFRGTLLGALPAVSGAGMVFFVKDASSGANTGGLVAVGLFGFLISLGLFIYEIYGIRRCAHLIVLGSHLEKESEVQGQFRRRPLGLEGFGLLPKGKAKYVSEPFAAGLIYPAVLGAWVFVAAFSKPVVAALLAFVVLGGSCWVAYRFNVWLHETDLPNLASDLAQLPVSKTAASLGVR
jgi:hypothetical protein